MKKAFVLIAVAAFLICVIPMVDSSDATGETTVSGYLSSSRDLTTGGGTTLTISIIYSNNESTGKIIGSVNSVDAWTASVKANKFLIPIEPDADLTKAHYYIYFNIYGYSISSTPTGYDNKTTIEVEGVKYTCFQMNGADIVSGNDNPTGTASSGWFNLIEAEGTVTGKVSTGSTEPVYLNGVIVKLYDINKKNELENTTTSNGGEYSISYRTGEYILTFELGGYKTEEMNVVITEETPTVTNVIMKETQSYFGFDLPHALMILGGTLAVVLLLFTLFMRMRLSKR